MRSITFTYFCLRIKILKFFERTYFQKFYACWSFMMMICRDFMCIEGKSIILVCIYFFYFLVIYFNDCIYSLEELNKILSLKPNFRKVGAVYIWYFYTWVLFLSIFCCFNSVLIITWSTVSNSKTFKAFNGVLMSILR